jgi:hypothetical protein
MNIIIKARPEQVATFAESHLKGDLYHFIHVGVGPVGEHDLALQRATNSAIIYFDNIDDVIIFGNTNNHHILNAVNNAMASLRK